MTAHLREVLAEVGESMPPARLTPDVWRRGRQARRRSRLRRSGAAGLVVLLVALALPWSLSRPYPVPWTAGDAGPAVPSRLALPWMWQATVQMDPPGPASVLFGGDSIGLRGTDIFDSEGKLAVVGRNSGDYRMLLYGGWDSIAAGENALLAPDGTRVAQSYLEGSGLDATAGVTIVDLTTGRSTQHGARHGTGCCEPVAWAPDGGSLLVSVTGSAEVTDPNTGYIWHPERLALLDLATDALVPLRDFTPARAIRTASRAAFAPDGQTLAVTEGSMVRLVDRTGTVRWSAELGDRTYLAGTGAFSADGSRITTVTLDGCLDECDEAALAARRWSVGFLDAATGRPLPGAGFAVVTGLAVRALGWANGRELVVLRYEPEAGAHKTRDQGWNDTGWYETGHVTLLALGPDGSTRTLIDPPDDVLTMDVAQDLLTAGRFGGPSSTASMFPARGIIWVAAIPLGCLSAVVGVVALLVVYAVRRRRTAARRH
ncbi:hypothetical protein GCM10022225_39170 [Plantactinospora mayteni]|uniref:Pyrrolo-quinoline quinone n=1 Tax=Plantactinospora mayteni TaxID=566021 RepID=A0ABQ4EWT1_9ACTN|nr:hypothetical protein [Plantactinospora mayteni]GIG99064.1 hypothetical protein Pma05_56370 [Plantactinospora mayteni]